MNVQCKNKKCNKLNNELFQVVRVLGPFKHVVMGLFRDPCVWEKKKNWLKGKNPPCAPPIPDGDYSFVTMVEIVNVYHGYPKKSITNK